MRAMLCHAFDGPEGLRLSTLPDVQPGPGAVAIAVAAAGVNFADTLMVRGLYQNKPPAPFAPGFEVAGTVAAVGEGVGTLAIGDRVSATMDYGGYADRVVLPAAQAVRIPDAMDFVTAAALPVAHGTALVALDLRAALKPGETLLVTGAGGGVGLAAIEIGKAIGAIVVASTGSEAKAEIARRHGADRTIPATPEAVRAEGKALAAGGFDVVLDIVGGDLADAALRSLAWGGRLLIVGFAGGRIPQIPANHLILRNTAVVGVHWSSHRRRDPASLHPLYARLFGWWSEGRIRPEIGARFPLEEAPAAMAALLSRKVAGKIVLTM